MLEGAELEHEVEGSRKDVASITESLEVIRYAKQQEWMKPNTVQAVYQMRLKEPPESSFADVEDDRRAAIAAAPRQLNAAMCLPDGYALVDSGPPAASASSDSSSATPAAPFHFNSTRVMKTSLHNLLMDSSPLYAHWFEIQMMEKMNQLASLQRSDSE
jgi:hypothetical protein